MTTEREYVEARWEDVVGEWGRDYPGRRVQTYHVKLPVIWWEGLSVMYATDPDAAWHAAYEFTLARAVAIRLVEEEVAKMNRLIKQETAVLAFLEEDGHAQPAFAYRPGAETSKRILARSTAALAELKRGWKG